MTKARTSWRSLVYLFSCLTFFPGVCSSQTQVATHSPVSPSRITSAEPVESKPSAFRAGPAQAKLRKKYDITKIGARGIGTGLNLYSFDREARLGKNLADQIDASVKLNTNPTVNDYVGRIVQNLVSHSDSKIPITVKVLYDAQANTFAIPGGYLYVTTGLILFCDDEAELAGTLAHEIAHVAARHGTRTLTKRELWGYASVALSLVGGVAGAAAGSFARVAGPLTLLKLGRNEELEADLLALEYAYLAGYDPQEFVRFFEKTRLSSDTRDNFFGKAFATHPQVEDRIQRAQSEVQILLPPRDDYIVDTSDFHDVKNALAIDIAIKATAEKPVLLHSSSKDEDVPPDQQAPKD